MVAGFSQTAFVQLPPLPVNFTGDLLQTTQALTGLGNNLSSWTLRIANAMNLLIPNGGPVPVSQGGTGATSFTAHGVLVGEGTSPIVATAAGASGIPLIGQGAADPIFGTAIVAGGGTGITSGTSGGIPYFSSTTTMASSALLQASGVVLGGGAGVAPFTAVGASTPPAMLSYNTVTNLAGVISPPAGTVLEVAAADGSITGIEIASGATNGRLIFYRANTQLGSPTALNGADTFGAIAGQGYDGTARSATAASIQFITVNPWSNTDHSCFTRVISIANGTTTQTTVANLKAPADGGSQLIGTTAADNAAAGFNGEYMEQIILIANEVNINAQANIATITVTAGDWDVEGELWVDSNTGTATLTGRIGAGISQTSATLPTVPATGTARTNINYTGVPATSTAVEVVPVGPARVNVNANTQLWLVGIANVTAGNAFGYGKIRARRVR